MWKDPADRPVDQISGAWRRCDAVAALSRRRTPGLPSNQDEHLLPLGRASPGCPDLLSNLKRCLLPSRIHKTPSRQRKGSPYSASRMRYQLLTASARPGPSSCSRPPWFHERASCPQDRCPPHPRQMSEIGIDRPL